MLNNDQLGLSKSKSADFGGSLKKKKSLTESQRGTAALQQAGVHTTTTSFPSITIFRSENYCSNNGAELVAA